MIVPSGYKIDLTIKLYTNDDWNPTNPFGSKKDIKLKLKTKEVFKNLHLKEAIQKLVELLINY